MATKKIDPLQILAIVSTVTSFAAQVAVAVIGKTGEALVEAIVECVKRALPVVEQILGKDLLHDEDFNEGLTALVRSIVRAPKAKKKK